MMDITKYLSVKKKLVDRHLRDFLPKGHGALSSLAAAMRYTVLSGGKRIRPILAIASAHACGGREKDVLPAACAIECIHAFTLIHDDLPAIDNSDLRRGKSTCHKVFGEATAILAGDCLMALAFDIMLRHTDRKSVGASSVLKVLEEVAQASGFFGVIGGEMQDIIFERSEPGAQEIKQMYILKTGALISASVRCGAIIAGANPKGLSALTSYAKHLGLAFQIVDDFLDLEGMSSVTGKPTGHDAKRGKATLMGAIGLDKAKMTAEDEIEAALKAIAGFKSEAEALREIAGFVVKRNN